MWELAGTLAVSAFGGTLVIHYLRNFFLRENLPLAWDWDGLLERAAVTFVINAAPAWIFLLPGIILLKLLVRLAGLSAAGGISKTDEPGAAYQKVLLKAEFALELILSPVFAILVGVIF
jgi:hypothetical protein